MNQTIEQKINQYLEENPLLEYSSTLFFRPRLCIEVWNWGSLNSKLPFSINEEMSKISYIEYPIQLSYYQEIDKMIKEANVAECLTSPSEYIRGVKKWFEENK